MTLTESLGVTGRAYAGGSATTFLPIANNPLTPVGGEIEGSIGVYPASENNFIQGNGNAQFAVSLDLLFSTSGPVRDGWIRPSYIGTFGLGPDGPHLQTLDISIGSFQPWIVIGMGTYPLQSFTLGQNFLFHEDLEMQATADPINGIYESAIPRFQWTFTLFEADGVTPVQVLLATPEPGSAMLWAGGLLALLTLIPRSLHREE